MKILGATLIYLLALNAYADNGSSSFTQRQRSATSGEVERVASDEQFERSELSLSAELMEFFSGEWSGAGEFANGKKIEADVTFTPDLDNRILVYRHTDRAPNKFKALAIWGFDRNSQKLLMTMNDNFGGTRLFVSEGWRNGALVFTKTTLLTVSSLHERFTYKRQSTTTFKMTYESSADGKEWKVGDYLVFTKKAR